MEAWQEEGGTAVKIQIEVDNNLTEDEIVIKCRQLGGNIQKIHEYITSISASAPKLAFSKDDVEYFLPLSDILFFETADGSVHAHTVDQSYQVKQRLYELEALLPYEFVRGSKSTILNVSHIFSISRNLTSSSLVQFHKSYKQVYVSRMYFKDSEAQA